jgi:hypothetical protein
MNEFSLNPLQSRLGAFPQTIPSQATIMPVVPTIFISGTVSIETVVPPTDGMHQLTLIFTDASPGIFLTSGNIESAVQPVQNCSVTLTFNPITNKYFPSSAGSGSAPTNDILLATKTLNDADIRGLPSLPIEVVVAPGMGKYLFPIMACIETDFAEILGSINISGLDIGASDIVITIGENAANMFRATPFPLINMVGKTCTVTTPYQKTFPRVADTVDLWANTFAYTFNGFDALENLKWCLSADNEAAGDFTGGNGNTINLIIYYSIKTFGQV